MVLNWNKTLKCRCLNIDYKCLVIEVVNYHRQLLEMNAISGDAGGKWDAKSFLPLVLLDEML